MGLKCEFEWRGEWIVVLIERSLALEKCWLICIHQGFGGKRGVRSAGVRSDGVTE